MHVVSVCTFFRKCFKTLIHTSLSPHPKKKSCMTVALDELSSLLSEEKNDINPLLFAWIDDQVGQDFADVYIVEEAEYIEMKELHTAHMKEHSISLLTTPQMLPFKVDLGVKEKVKTGRGWRNGGFILSTLKPHAHI